MTETAGIDLLAPQNENWVDQVLRIVEGSSITKYYWKNRGISPIGYIKGMAIVFTRFYCRLKIGDNIISEISKAKKADNKFDALTWYDEIFKSNGMSNDKDGVETLRNLFVLLIGLGMRESSGKYCEGRDRNADNITAENAEAGLFQTSYNARKANSLLPQIFKTYLNNPLTCKEIFQEGVRCNANDLENFGLGEGMEFQRLSKESPAFAVEFAAVALRNIRNHWGPINNKHVEIRPECAKMLKQIEETIDKFQL